MLRSKFIDYVYSSEFKSKDLTRLQVHCLYCNLFLARTVAMSYGTICVIVAVANPISPRNFKKTYEYTYAASRHKESCRNEDAGRCCSRGLTWENKRKRDKQRKRERRRERRDGSVGGKEVETRSDIQRRWRLMPRSGSGGNLGARLKTRPSCFPAYSPAGWAIAASPLLRFRVYAPVSCPSLYQ